MSLRLIGGKSTASMAVAIIAKDSEKTIGRCLDSIVPYVRQVLVCVDSTTKDKTLSVAKQHRSRVVPGFRVLESHTCLDHGTIQVQHFAKARQASFDLLPKDVDWWMWLDADDIVEGGENLTKVLAKTSLDCAGLWLPYHYSKVDDTGPTTTLFDRERIVRASMPWRWQYRVHEILVPTDHAGNIIPTEHLNWSRTEDVKIVHQGIGHNTKASATRNITLLEIDLEENPQDMRALFYLGNQYYAMEMFPEAIHYYEQSTQAQNPYQVWQTWIYLSMAYERLGDFQSATKAAYMSMDVAPYHPEPYYRLAAMAMLAGDSQRCEFWTRFGDRLPDAPNFAFRNPLDRTFNSKVTLGNAYANAGEVSKARREFEQAYCVVPGPVIKEGIDNMAKMEQDTRLADSYVNVLQSHNGAVASFGPIPTEVWKFGRVRDLVVPNIMKHRPNTQPRLVIWCGQSLEPWAPPSINTTGIGGSETAVIEIAKRFGQDGWLVDIYNNPDHLEGEYDGVGYWGLNRLHAGENAKVFVSWRRPQDHSLPLTRQVSLLWCHDLNSGPVPAESFSVWDRVLGVSDWHQNYLWSLYGGSNYSFVPNGINPDRFESKLVVKREPFRCVYASSPDRGLDKLLQMWPNICKDEPAAELHIAYGWETFDKAVSLGPSPNMVNLKEYILHLLKITPQVVWRGRLPQDELAKLYQESYLWLYPTSFLEVSCITAMEAMAGGCVPVTSAAGALPETIQDGGIVVTGNTYTQAWKDYYVLCARAALLAPDVRLPTMQKGLERSKHLTWDQSYLVWKELVSSALCQPQLAGVL